MTLRPLLLAASLFLLLAVPAKAEDAAPPVTEILLAHSQKQDSANVPMAAMAAVFKREVEQRTAGKIKVGIFPAGQLGGNRDMAKLVSRNVIQMAIVTIGGIAPIYPAISVIEMPFALPSRQTAYRVFDGPFGQRLAADMEQHTGLALLGFGDGGGFFAITNSRHPIHSPRDMQGLKIRTVPGFEPMEAMIRSLGATPVEVSSREEITALTSGVIDGVLNPPLTLLAGHYDEVQKYATLTDFLYVPTLWVANHDALAKLDPAQQDAVRQSAALALAAGRTLASTLEESDHGLPALHRRMEVTSPTPAERQAIKDTVQPVVAAALTKTLGDDGARLLAEFLAAAGQDGK